LPDSSFPIHAKICISRVVERQATNSMTVHNIAVIFGPTLFGINMPMMMNGHGNVNGGPSPGGGGSGLGDVGAQSKASQPLHSSHRPRLMPVTGN